MVVLIALFVSTNVFSDYALPVRGDIIKKFSDRHTGLTFDSRPNKNVRVIRDGNVIYASDAMKTYGKMVIVRHPLGFYSSYTQNRELKVKAGDKVKKGQIISITGSTPFYFELKKFEKPVDPSKYINVVRWKDSEQVVNPYYE